MALWWQTPVGFVILFNAQPSESWRLTGRDCRAACGRPLGPVWWSASWMRHVRQWSISAGAG
jgi:hypothetical protein